MRVFITGATGFIGSAVVRELLGHGHQVLGLSRSDAGAAALAAAGADVHRGSMEEPESLTSGARAADAVIHLAFNHDFSKFAENSRMDARSIETLGAALAGTDKPLLVTAGVAGIAGPGQIATENDSKPDDYSLPRVSEQTALELKDVRASVIRLPQVHDTEKQGLVSYIIPIAREKAVSAYVGDGGNRWAAAHVTDVARLYRLALEKHEPGARWHAVAEEGVPMKEIAEAIGRGLKVPTRSLSPETAPAHFGTMGYFVGSDLMASSAITRQKLGWTPTGPGLIADLDGMNYG